MAKDINPVTAHAKAQKRATQKKTKLAVLKARTERLAKRNPSRLEKQIADLKSQENNGSLRPKDAELLKTLEKELGQVKKARERTGQGEQQGARRGGLADGREGEGDGERRDRGVKRVREDRDQSEEEETDEDVRGIPMPRDTPPPIPRRDRRADNGMDGRAEKRDAAPAQISYSSAPVMRDLRKEATGAKFAPAQVRRNLERVKGKGGLVEEEEWERLEKGGYVGRQGGGEGEGGAEGGREVEGDGGGRKGVTMEEVEDEDL
ncbi:hypothetical protein BDZ85DRAFT_311586 [Elsinoe ampelina]|uniref:Wbp11/ELF5/Saf1 N-terminal domain-containing protein n=1 Tax=Elsinoe ampelina TaxID=302913 RepID=A0A6A6GD39_9PEZI|nr:hypothetical protein BDZ85DRAFT_311586 [Elsinoe ampelina]